MTREEQAQYISEKLMENPEFKKAFVGAITDAVNEVVKVIKALEQEPCEDSIVEWKKDFKEYVNSLSMPRDDYNGIMEYIDELPVTPQYTDAEIQKMQDLEFAEIQTAYEIGKAENPNKWIPVSERLPKAGEYVGDVAKYYLVQNEYGDMLVARYTHGEYWEQIYQLKPIGDEIVAWMPLPEPYKQEVEE